MLTPLKQLLDTMAIVEVVVGIASAFDSKWDRLQSLLADELDIDYTGFVANRREDCRACLYQVTPRPRGLARVAPRRDHEVKISGDRERVHPRTASTELSPGRPGENLGHRQGVWQAHPCSRHGRW
jgi:hypothetical protein